MLDRSNLKVYRDMKPNAALKSENFRVLEIDVPSREKSQELNCERRVVISSSESAVDFCLALR